MKTLLQKQTLRSATTEILSIVIGVLLALAVNEWNENRVNKQKAEQALINITAELQSNIKLMKIIHANNAAIVNLPEEPDAANGSEEKRFIPGLQIQDIAWKTLISTGISAHIEYETLYMVSEIYSVQQIYKSIGFQMINTMMSTSALSVAINPENDKNINYLFLDNMALVVEIEAALLILYENALKKLTV